MYVEECYDVTAIRERIESKTIKRKQYSAIGCYDVSSVVCISTSHNFYANFRACESSFVFGGFVEFLSGSHRLR